MVDSLFKDNNDNAAPHLDFGNWDASLLGEMAYHI
jgi:hypothetical protein